MNSQGGNAGTEATGEGRGGDVEVMLIASDRSWLVAALDEILAGADIDVVRSRTTGETLAAAEAHAPSIVLLDEDLPDGDLVDLCERLSSRYLAGNVPLVLYSARTFVRTDVHSDALDAGVWTIVRAPLQARSFVALVRRLLEVGGRVERPSSTREDLVDAETGVFTLSGLQRVLPSLGALAVRNQSPVSLVVLAPTGAGEGAEDRDRWKREFMAKVCKLNVRSADVCAWFDGDELAIVAYDTSAEGARQLVQRLNAVASDRETAPERGADFSAGIVELKPRNGLPEAVSRAGQYPPREIASAEFQNLFSLSAAKEALHRARQEGGGVEVAEAR